MLLEPIGEPAEEVGRRRDDRVGRRVALADLSRVDVDVHEGRGLQLRREAIGRHVAEARADCEDDIDAGLEIRTRRGVTTEPEHAERERMILGKHALGLGSRGDRTPETLGGRAQPDRCTVTTYAVAGEDQRAFGRGDERDDLVEDRGLDDAVHRHRSAGARWRDPGGRDVER
jgi:hypothetical protein